MEIENGIGYVGTLKIDETTHQLHQTRRFRGYPRREVPDGMGVVGGVMDGLGQKRDGPRRGFEFVRDVGDEVPAQGLEPALFGDVLDEHRVIVLIDAGDADTEMRVHGVRRVIGVHATTGFPRHGATVTAWHRDLTLPRPAISDDLGKNVHQDPRGQARPIADGQKSGLGAGVSDDARGTQDHHGVRHHLDQTPARGRKVEPSLGQTTRSLDRPRPTAAMARHTARKESHDHQSHRHHHTDGDRQRHDVIHRTPTSWPSVSCGPVSHPTRIDK